MHEIYTRRIILAKLDSMMKNMKKNTDEKCGKFERWTERRNKINGGENEEIHA